MLHSSLEGGFQGSRGWLEGSFEASASLRRLRLRARVGKTSAIGSHEPDNFRLGLRKRRGCAIPGRAYHTAMTLEFAYQYRQDASRSGLRDLDRVALTSTATSDDGDVLAPGTEGTIVSVYCDGEAYVIEFPTPVGALATVRPEDIRLVERARITSDKLS